MSDKPNIRFHTSTRASWDAMLNAIRQAEISVDLEQFVFEPDEIGSTFLKTIIKKAESGVKVRLLFDMVGSLSLYLSDLPDQLREKGIQVSFFNPISFWRLHNITSHLFRDHRKILVVDHIVGFVGGVGIADTMADWRDTVIEMQGDFVKNIEYTFDLVWKRTQKRKYRRFKRPPLYVKDYEILINSPRFRQRFMYFSYVAHIRNAQDYIFLSTPYFVPDRRFFRALRVAAHRGVDVRLILPAVSNHHIIDYIQGWYITRALKSGIKIYTYSERFYHAKTGIIDNAWATVGSCNLDNLSFIFNHEANIASSDPACIEALKSHFGRDLAASHEIVFEKWKRRFIGRRFLEALTWPFHKLF